MMAFRRCMPGLKSTSDVFFACASSVSDGHHTREALMIHIAWDACQSLSRQLRQQCNGVVSFMFDAGKKFCDKHSRHWIFVSTWSGREPKVLYHELQRHKGWKVLLEKWLLHRFHSLNWPTRPRDSYPIFRHEVEGFSIHGDSD